VPDGHGAESYESFSPKFSPRRQQSGNIIM
jgi:hypothetical protein